MRWSLFLSVFITVQAALSLVSVALPISSESPWDELDRREPARTKFPASNSAKASSKVYRKNALSHPHVYSVSQNGDVRRSRATTRFRTPKKSDADHVLEHQLYKKVLKNHNLDHKTLPPALQAKSKAILNRPRNMVMIPAGINRGKGSLVKHALNGKAIAPKKARDRYTLLSYPTAKRTAQKLDKAFDKHLPGKINQANGFASTLRKTMNSAKILRPNQPSPAGSLSSSSGSSSSGSPPKSRNRPATPGSPSPAQGSIAKTRGKK